MTRRARHLHDKICLFTSPDLFELARVKTHSIVVGVLYCYGLNRVELNIFPSVNKLLNEHVERLGRHDPYSGIYA